MEGASDDRGHVEPDGDVLERRDGPLLLRKRSVAEMDNNVYALACAATGKALLVDAAARPEKIRAMVADLEPVAVVQTHGHWDHVRAWHELRTSPGLPVWGHAGDAELFPGPLDRELSDGERIVVGELTVEVLHTPGHTDGSLQYLVHGELPHLVSGDSLFPGGLGNTWGDERRFEQLFTEVRTKVFERLPDATRVHPGHGDDTTLGVERPHLDEWYARRW